MKFFFLIILITTTLHSNAQFTDSTTKMLKVDVVGSINKTQSDKSYLFNNTVAFNVKKKRTSINSNASWLYGMTPNKLTNNDFAFSSTVNLFPHSENFYYWGLMGYKSSFSLNIKNQGQAGIGVAYNFLNKPNIWLNLSNGIIGELSNIIQADSTVLNYQTVRNSLRLQFMLKIGDRAVFQTGNFYQPSFEYINDYLLSSETEFNYQLWKGLSLNTRLLYSKTSRTKKENLILTYGLGYQKYF